MFHSNKRKQFFSRAMLLFFLASLSTIVFGQVFTNKEVGKKNADLIDSLKKSDYPYSLPILGAKATKAGYDLPYSAGFSAQYFWQQSDLVIDNLNVGFNNGPLYNLDGLVRFDKAFATASAFTVRPDIWLFPFLNIYGIFGKAQASTEVGFGVWIPDPITNTDTKILSASTTVEFNTSTYGLGFTPTIGVAGGFLALDMNVAWTDVPQLSKPAQSFIFGPRLGKNFKLKKPGQTIAIWAGGFRVHLSSETNGSIALSEVLPPDFGTKVDDGIQKVGNAQQQVDAWWASLTPAQQANPVNQAKHNTANRVLARAGEILASADNAINNIGTSTVQYSMDKRPKDAWNFIVGSQYQLNKHFMLRGEYGFLGSRTQFLVGLQYRFGL